jgi:hypothetical protein
MPNVPNVTNIPAPRVEFIDPRTGLMAREWYRFFYNLFNLTGAGSVQVSTEDLQLGPSDNSATSTFAELQNQIDGLAVAPALTPHTSRLRYGSFYDTTTQTAAAINTAYAMTINATDLSFGVYVGSPTSRIYVDNPGIYNIQFSAQLDKVSGGTSITYIWLRHNGNDVANSAGQIRIQGNNAETLAAWNYLLQMNAGDYFEIMWATDDTNTQILAEAASGVHPGIPSVIITVTDNISWQGY